MAASLQNRIEDYIGPRHSDMELTDWVTALSQWLTASAKELFDIIPEMTLKKVAPATISSATTGTSLAGKRIFGVDIEGYPAREVPALEWAKVTNQNSIHYARSTDPVFYIKEGKLYVITDGAETAEGTIHYISAPEVTYDLTTVPYFPTEYEPLVVLGAAVRGKMRQIVDTRSTLPILLDDTDLEEIANAVTAVDLVDDFEKLKEYVEDEEDVELAGAKASEIKAKLDEMQVELTAEQQDMTHEYQRQLQIVANNIKIISGAISSMQAELQGLQGLYQQELQILMGSQQGGDK